MRVLITGREGQLAQSLLDRATAYPSLELITAARPLVDLEQPGSIGEAIRAVGPGLVINAAAYTAVDQAEQEPERAFRINADAAGEAAEAAAEVGASFIQISTDYVFNGKATEPYAEDAPTDPLGVYGASKLAGEEAVRGANPQHLIVRTSWVYSPFGRNFVRTMLDLARSRDEVRVVADQRGSPTSALDLAEALLQLAERCATGNERGWSDTYHLTAAGSCSWADFATETFSVSEKLGGPSANVLPITSAEYPTPARRPALSVLATHKAEGALGISLPHWRRSLEAAVARLLAAAS
jgi:dTDP-4-dehydrorhamnose reductase